MKCDTFSNRLIKLIGSESRAAFARRCGISEGAIRSYLNGAMPSIDKAITIADTCNVRLEWLITGEGTMMRGDAAPVEMTQPSEGAEIDAKLIGRLTDKVLRTYRDLGMGIAIHEAAEMAVEEHNRIVATVTDPTERMVCVGEFAERLRQRLLKTPANSTDSKHLA